MNWHNVEIFVDVMRTLSFTDVARQRDMAPSSVSRAIASLEDDLGVKLFQRSPRQILATEAGELFFQKVSGLVTGFAEAREAVREVTQVPRGTLRVTAPIVYGQKMLVPRLAEFRHRYPEIAVELQLTDRYTDLLAERIDVAIRLGELEDSNYVGQRLHGMTLRLCAAPAYLQSRTAPRTPEELADHDCLIFMRESGAHRPNLWRFRRCSPNGQPGPTEDITINGQYRFNNSAALRQCALDGLGLIVLPDWLIGQDIRDGKLIPLLQDYEATSANFDHAAWLLQPSRGYQPLKSRVFIDYLRETIGE